MTGRAKKCGAAGAVVDGYSRDTGGVLDLGFPTFSHGSYAQDQGPRGKVLDFRIPIQVGQVRVSPGDIVFGDMDGVCVVPRVAEQEALARAASFRLSFLCPVLRGRLWQTELSWRSSPSTFPAPAGSTPRTLRADTHEKAAEWHNPLLAPLY